MNTAAFNSPAISDVPTDTSSVGLLDREETNRETTKTRKAMITTNTPVDSNSAMSLLNQLPPIMQFSGEEQSDGETFLDWLEQFESVAQLGGWNGHAKLVNLTA